ncbi:hypothetical protein BHE74_00053397 [Ensete ventricosum]|uniref:Uncharacterized protein n=1 Tax=Ensete ventricosum TaxID=4639 RepID=A0A426XRD0_ENSVE|nr:hypothetical protein B296_00057376 [Ensete ventricosum]RWW41133.1 hypothetical protein BHE74_00053397 [Ensete ventricosum]
MASMSSSWETFFLLSLRALLSSALAVFRSVFSFPLPGFFVFFPILEQSPPFSLRRSRTIVLYRRAIVGGALASAYSKVNLCKPKPGRRKPNPSHCCRLVVTVRLGHYAA